MEFGGCILSICMMKLKLLLLINMLIFGYIFL